MSVTEVERDALDHAGISAMKGEVRFALTWLDDDSTEMLVTDIRVSRAAMEHGAHLVNALAILFPNVDITVMGARWPAE
jgi:hypothetical protein